MQKVMTRIQQLDHADPIPATTAIGRLVSKPRLSGRIGRSRSDARKTPR